MRLSFICILFVSIRTVTADDYGNQESLNTLERFRRYIEEFGSDNFESQLEELLNEWKNYPIHIGITGRSGVGKSSFINTIRGLRSTDSAAAPVGVDETTKKIQSYPDIKHTNLTYWDLPGCGTLNFPRSSYLQTVDFIKFDHLIIMTADRFTEDDLWLVEEAKHLRKPFFLVRNKIDNVLNSEREDHPLRTEDDILATIRNNLIHQLNDKNLPVYLISARFNHYYHWDFPKLIEDLIENSPKIKQEALIFSMNLSYKAGINQKIQALRQRTWKTATLSAAVSAIPIPGVSVAADIALLAREIKLYKQLLALDIDSLTKIGNIHGIVLDELKTYYRTLDDQNYYELIFGREVVLYITKRIGTYAASAIAKEALRYIPFVGQVISSGTSFGITYMLLNDLLDDLHIAALKLLYYIELNQQLNL